MSVDGAEHLGCPSMSKMNENVHIKELVHEKRCNTISKSAS
jgi:hypothetical protein